MLMTPYDAHNQYKSNSVYTATPEELTLMLYNGIVKFIMQAQAGIDARDITKAHTGIIKAQNIVLHLQKTLDMKYELSDGLSQMYEYMYRRLLEANVRKDKEMLEEVLGYAKELRETWSQAMRIAKTPVKKQAAQ
jgi:flagellar protein FliS